MHARRRSQKSRVVNWSAKFGDRSGVEAIGKYAKQFILLYEHEKQKNVLGTPSILILL